VIAIDTNVVVYPHRPEAPFHEVAYGKLEELVSSGQRYGLPMPCLVEFAGVARHPKIRKVPSSPAEVREQVEAWLEPPSAWVLTEEDAIRGDLFDLIDSAQLCGGAVHDARIMAC
jgi:predicted nucleic acid-binding protein